MTKNEMKKLYLSDAEKVNYELAQQKIMNAMKIGNMHVEFMKERYNFLKSSDEFYITDDTIKKLKNDGFEIDEIRPHDSNSVVISWYE